MEPTINGFDYQRVPVADGVALNAAVGGSGRPIVLLHGFPQTHLMWRHVAADLAADHTVIGPNLRGYGDSDKPADTGAGTYSKRAMAADVVALARSLGHDRFALAGHNRGALVAVRAGLDHPDAVTRLASLDVLPTLDMWDVMRGVSAAVGFHLYLMAQPADLPGRPISAAPDVFFGHFLDTWSRAPGAIPADVRAAYLKASREAVASIVADYRASAGVDVEHDEADRRAGKRLSLPVSVLQQDWGPPWDSTAPRCGGRGPPTCGTPWSPAATSWRRRPRPRSSGRCATSWPGRALPRSSSVFSAGPTGSRRRSGGNPGPGRRPPGPGSTRGRRPPAPPPSRRPRRRGR